MVELLQEALARRGDVQIEICAILNDTTGIYYEELGNYELLFVFRKHFSKYRSIKALYFDFQDVSCPVLGATMTAE